MRNAIAGARIAPLLGSINMKSSVPHGGNLGSAMQTFGGRRRDWLDLSTGINPTPYKFKSPSLDTWARLPQQSALAALQEAAANAYGIDSSAALVIGGGTQAIIQSLPYCREVSDVAVVGFTYAEHALAWRRAGHRVTAAANLEHALQADVIVLTNPNNPDGRMHTTAELERTADALRPRDGLLVVDEAFADVAQEQSIAGATNLDGVVVTRSFGKFFGLAGVRLGFAITNPELAARLQAQLGPWPAAGPSIAVATTALRDCVWQHDQRVRLVEQCADLCAVLQQAGLNIVGGTALFTLVEHDNARALWRHLAQRHILTRHFEDRPAWLRFGLANGSGSLTRLTEALSAYFDEAA